MALALALALQLVEDSQPFSAIGIAVGGPEAVAMAYLEDSQPSAALGIACLQRGGGGGICHRWLLCYRMEDSHPSF